MRLKLEQEEDPVQLTSLVHEACARIGMGVLFEVPEAHWQYVFAVGVSIVDPKPKTTNFKIYLFSLDNHNLKPFHRLMLTV